MKNFFKIIIFLIILALISTGIFFILNQEKKVVEIKIEDETDNADRADSADVAKETDKTDMMDRTNEANKINNLEIKKNLVSFGFEKKAERKIDTIIIHSSYDALGNNPYDVSGLIKEYQQYGVAPHYLIDRKGVIYQLVEEKNVAYHAGESKTPDGRSGVNAFSIGIELMNTKTDKYTDEQYKSLKKLLEDIGKRYKIKYTLGHKDVSPGRKDDPWNFDNSFLVY